MGLADSYDRKLGAISLDRHRADFFFDFCRVDHGDRIPGAAIQEAAIWSFAQTLLAADAQDGINCDAAEGRIIFVWHPEHAVFDGAIFDAGGRTRASCAAFGDHRQLFRFLLARRG